VLVVKVDTLRATCSKEAVILYNVVNLVPLTVSHADSKAPSRTPIPMHSGFSSPQLTALDTKIKQSQNPFLLQRAGPRLSTTHYAEPEIQNAVEESFDDQAYKFPASTFRRTSSKLHKTLLASLKSGSQSRLERTSSTTSAARGGSEKTVLSLRVVHSSSALQSGANHFSRASSRANQLCRTSSVHSTVTSLLAEDSDLAVLLNPDKATRSPHAEEPDVQKLKRGSTSSSSALYSGAKHLSQTSSVHSGASSHSQSAEDLAGPLHSKDKATCCRHSEEPDGQKLSRGSTPSSPETNLTSGLPTQRHNSSILQSVRRRGSMMSTAADLGSVHSKHSGVSSQSAQGLAGTLHSAHRDKLTCRRHSEEPGGQKLARGSNSSSPGVIFTSQTQRHGSSVLQSVQSRRRGSLMLTAAGSNVAVSSGSAFYASQVMARQASKHKVARAKPRPWPTDSRQSTQSNQLAEACVQVGIGRALRLGLFSVFSTFASLLGLLVSMQTYVSLVMAPARLVAACLSSQPPWSGEPKDGRRFYCERANGLLESQRRRSSTEDMWAMEALALNYDFSM